MTRKYFFGLLAFAFVFVGLLAALFAVSVSESSAAPCRTRVVAVHQAAVVAEVVPVFQAVAVTVPTYSVGFYPQAQQSVSHDSEQLKIVVDEVIRLRADLDQLRRVLAPIPIKQKEVTKPPEGVPAPEPAKVPEPAKAGEGLSYAPIFAAKCASCHDAGVADKKGGKLILMNGAALAPLTDGQRLKIIRAVFDGTMPKSGKQLSDEDVSTIVMTLK